MLWRGGGGADLGVGGDSLFGRNGQNPSEHSGRAWHEGAPEEKESIRCK